MFPSSFSSIMPFPTLFSSSVEDSKNIPFIANKIRTTFNPNKILQVVWSANAFVTNTYNPVASKNFIIALWRKRGIWFWKLWLLWQVPWLGWLADKQWTFDQTATLQDNPIQQSLNVACKPLSEKSVSGFFLSVTLPFSELRHDIGRPQ